MNIRTLVFALLAGAVLPSTHSSAANMVGLPPCTFYGESMSADLSTTHPENWQVTGPHANGPTQITFVAWTALPNDWIQPRSSTELQNVDAGDYTYLIRFYIPCNPQNYRGLSLTGSIAADNSFKAYVNGITTPFAVCGGSYCFNAPANPTAFANIANMLVRGVNTIQIVVHNDGAVSGLAMSAMLRASCGRECCQLLQNPDLLHNNPSN